MGEAEIEVLVAYPEGKMPLRHKIIFGKGQERFRLIDEKIENERPQTITQSDGSLRYLCLLAILLDPTPPPLICIDEPELGLHPDVIPKIADLLVSASDRTQIVVTTHSRMLIDAMSNQPDNVIVCSKTNGQSKFERLNAAELSEWLEKYTLGDLWSMGEIGGNRW